MSATSTSTDFNKDLPIYDEEDDLSPTKEDCCNTGCSPCVFDMYEKRMEEKKKRKKGEQYRYDLLSQTTFKPFILLEKHDFYGFYSRLTFQPFVPKIEIVKKYSKNIVLESNKGLENVISLGEKKVFEVKSKENQDSDNIMIVEQNSANIVSGGNKTCCQNVTSRFGKGFEVTSKENQDSDNMFLEEDSKNILDRNKDYQNVASRVGKGFEVFSMENQDSDNNMLLEEDSKNILDRNKDYQNVASRVGKGFEAISKETQVLDIMISDTIKEDETILEQQINGYLPYKPGQHFTMKSWWIDNTENHKKMRKEDQQIGESNRETYQDIPRKEDVSEDTKSAGIKFGLESEVMDQNLPKKTTSKQTIMGTDVNNYQDTPGNEDVLEDPESAGIKFMQKSGVTDQNLPKNPTSKQTIKGTTDVTYQYIPRKEDILEDPESAAIKFEQKSEVTDQNLPKNPTSKQTIMGTNPPNFITRDYTPITLAKSCSNCCFQIIIKYYEDGDMSKYLKSLKKGDQVLFRGPYGKFEYLKNHNHVLGICMGTGVAPIFTVFRKILDDERDETFMKLLYGCKDLKGILLRDELREMAKFWNFRAEMFLTSGVSKSAKFGEHFRAGRITKNCVFENLKPKQLVLVCGSETFNSEIVGYLAEFDRWEVEYFVF